MISMKSLSTKIYKDDGEILLPYRRYGKFLFTNFLLSIEKRSLYVEFWLKQNKRINKKDELELSSIATTINSEPHEPIYDLSDSIIRDYNDTTLMSEIISEDILIKLKNNQYTNEETIFFCNGITEEYDKLSTSTSAMIHWMVESYYNTDIMRSVVSEDIIKKVEKGLYTDEEIRFLYAAVTEKYDRIIEEHNKSLKC